MTNPVLRVPAYAALRVFCHPERSEGSAFCFAPRPGSASIWPIATDLSTPQGRPPPRTRTTPPLTRVPNLLRGPNGSLGRAISNCLPSGGATSRTRGRRRVCDLFPGRGSVSDCVSVLGGRITFGGDEGVR